MVKESRYHALNKVPYKEGSVLYWMNRDMRLEDNWALLRAQEVALEKQVPLLVVYNLDPHFLGGTRRQYDFKVSLLKELVVQAERLNISFSIVVGKDTEKEIVSFIDTEKVGYLITDFSPLRVQRQWLEYIVKHVSIPCERVDAHNIVPVWIASQKQEVGARTLRPKLYRLLPEYLEPFPSLLLHPHQGKKKSIDWHVVTNASVDESVAPVTWIVPSYKKAHDCLHTFVTQILPHYALDRNDPTKQAQSNLSPYLHYGVLAPARVALEALSTVSLSIEQVLHGIKNAAKVSLTEHLSLKEHVASFLEELIIRRELSDNFCFYNPHYDAVEGFSSWAQQSLKKHERDTRDYVYTKKQFEHAQTHDDLWNAAQKEMVRTGKMHGYMRMYWAKKILEWSSSVEEAMKIAIALNDTYELDGRDPNGYAGIAWSIGGVHDRPWFDRPIFGVIRYMARSGCEKKFDVSRYIEMQQ